MWTGAQCHTGGKWWDSVDRGQQGGGGNQASRSPVLEAPTLATSPTDAVSRQRPLSAALPGGTHVL